MTTLSPKEQLVNMETKLAAHASHLATLQSQLKQKEVEGEKIRQSIAPIAEQVIRKEGLDALLRPSVASAVVDASRSGGSASPSLLRAVNDLLATTKAGTETALVELKASRYRRPRIEVEVYATDTMIVMPGNFDEILTSLTEADNGFSVSIMAKWDGENGGELSSVFRNLTPYGSPYQVVKEENRYHPTKSRGADSFEEAFVIAIEAIHEHYGSPR